MPKTNYAVMALIALGSLLLFSVQPFLGKALLPVYGGTISTWLTCLLFFQAVLCLGYLYSFLLTQYLSKRNQRIFHLTVIIASLLQLPIHFKFISLTSPILSILQTLLICIFGPYFIVSTNVSFLQSLWRKKNGRSENLAGLYALSNFASFAALLAYPFLLEPNWGVTAQARYWSCGFFVYSLGVCVIIILHLWKSKNGETETPSKISSQFNIEWLSLSFLGNALLISGTANLTQNIASIPFLWILPLMAYLLSFVVSFSLNRATSRLLWLSIFLLSAAIVTGIFNFFGKHNLALQVAMNLSLIFSGCMLVHRRLFELRPSDANLPLFYFWIAAGGLTASLVIGILPSIIFNNFYEFQITIFLIVVYLFNWKLKEDGLIEGGTLLAYCTNFLSVSAGFILILLISKSNSTISQRNFFGVLKISDEKTSSAEPIRIMHHGSIMHGLQFRNQPKSEMPGAYYCPYQLAGRLLTSDKRSSPIKVAIIGLGAGGLSAYMREGDQLRFYEINPLVIEVAQKYFTYLARSKARIDYVIGDARKTLETERDRFDAIFVDAFNGDAIPVHLLTKEALELYFQHLNENGYLVLHISNSFLDLKMMLSTLASELNYSAYYLKSDANIENQCLAAEYALLTRPGFNLKRILSETDINQLTNLKDINSGVRAWTDDFSSFFEIAR